MGRVMETEGSGIFAIADDRPKDGPVPFRGLMKGRAKDLSRES